MTNEEITQWIRVGDVLIIMPLMLTAASNKNLDPGLRVALGIAGVGTGVYNAIRWYTHLK